MRNLAPETEAVVDYVRGVHSAGPKHIAFDGLRVFDHPARLTRFLVGRGVDVIPVTIELWPSLSCDARCPTCPYRLSGARNEADHTEELHLLEVGHAREIIHDLAAAGVRSVIFTGGGEPLMHPRLVEIVSAAVQAGLSWALFTNGLALSLELGQQLLELGPRFLRVSLDAGTPERHARTYALEPSAFYRVTANVRAAAQVAQRLGSRSFGLGFTLEPTVASEELADIRDLLRALLAEVGSGLSLVVFRPRVIQYRLGKPVCPQPHASSFEGFADRIQDEIVNPLLPAARITGTRLDIKKGLFVLADARRLPLSCLSSSWMTNLDHKGYGYLTAELAGAPYAGQSWGRVLRRGDFLPTWFSPFRQALFEKLASGKLTVPPIHRTSPVDAALQGIYMATGGPIDHVLAQEVLDAVRRADLGKTTNGDFI